MPIGVLVALGCLLCAAGSIVALSLVGPTPHYASEILPGWLIGGAGVGLALPAILSSATADLPPSEAATGSAVVNMSRQIGTALGVSIVVAVLGTPVGYAATHTQLPARLGGQRRRGRTGRRRRTGHDPAPDPPRRARPGRSRFGGNLDRGPAGGPVMSGDAQTFAAVSAVRAAADGGFDVVIDPEWTIAGKPNGGYLLAMMARAARSVGPHPDPLAAGAHYLRPPDPGPAHLEVEVLRAGRSAAQTRVRLSQAGAVCVEALLTLGHLDPAAEPLWAGGVPSIPEVRFEDAVRVDPAPLTVPVAIFGQVDARLDPDTAGFARGRPSGRGELRGWLALPGGEDFDAVSLQYALDSFPPATLDIELSGWVPTLELTTYVRAVPAPGPVRVLQRAQLIQGGRVDEACFVWDSRGRLVAQGTQLAAIRFNPDPGTALASAGAE